MWSDETKVLLVRLLRFGFVIYYVISIVFRLCFRMPDFQMFDHAHVAFFDYLADAFFLWDFISRFRSNVVVPSEAVIARHTRRRSVRHHQNNSRYRRSIFISHAIGVIGLRKASTWQIILTNIWEFVDIISFIPVELVGFGFGISWYYALRVTRLIRVKHYFHYWNDISEILHHFKIATTSYAIKRVLLLIISLAVVGHVGACFFFAISLRSMREGSTDAWIYYDGLANLDADKNVVYTSTLGFRYLRSMYWSIQTLDTVGFGDVVAKSEAETWFCILFFYISAFLIYYTVANLMEVVTNYDSARTAALLKQSRFDQYATYRKLPKDLAERVRSYYNHQWKLLKGVDEREVWRY